MLQPEHREVADNRSNVDDPLAAIEHATKIRVRYADTDQMGLVYYGKYFEYFEVARTEMLRACGLPYSEIEQAGYGLPVRDASARYYRGATYDDLLRVTARMKSDVATRLEISYTVHMDATNELLAEGNTTLVFVLKETGRPTKPPDIYRQAIEAFTAPDIALST
ncbi:MAG: thioesterase family protein [Bacteroidota bacterium]|nr:thioesterase family protein [Bacteroidota bacterium]MDP4233643.1 thioesterase family protein [Bacteroidota bacterium]MDP4243097.1 thioesterase family protein [Bacteroidota bacterium]MDP4288457.1 thioesterase family protein [Bacteroidota bacterium]